MESALRVISKALQELESPDFDLRYMALSDLHQVLSDDERGRQLANQRQMPWVSQGILKALQDPITEVQNQAVKALGPLVVIFDNQLDSIVSTVAKLDSTVKDMALRAIIQHTQAGAENARIIISRLLPSLCENKDPSIETTDVFLDLVKRFKTFFTDLEVDNAITKAIQLGNAGSGLVSKRAFDILVLISSQTNLEQFDRMYNFAASLDDHDKWFKIAAFQMFCGLCTTCPGPMKSKPTFEYAAKYQELEEDQCEVTEAALLCIEALVKIDAARDISTIVSEALDYDPNLGDMDIDDEDEDFGSDFEQDDIDDDDSWRVRRAAVRVVRALPDSSHYLGQLVQVLGREQNHAVKVELLNCLASMSSAASRKRRRSEADMEVVPEAISTEKIVKLASQDSETVEYLTLLTSISKTVGLGSYTTQAIHLCAARLKSHRTKQIVPVLELLESILNRKVVSTNEVESIVDVGLKDKLFRVQMLALQCALLLNNVSFIPAIEHIVVHGIGAAIRSLALTTGAKILANNESDAAHFFDLTLHTLENEAEQRVSTVVALANMLKSVRLDSERVNKLVVSVSNLYTLTSSSFICACLELFAVVAVKYPETRHMIADYALRVPNDAQFIDSKSKVLAKAPIKAQETLEFALHIAKVRSKTELNAPSFGKVSSPLIELFGVVVAAHPELNTLVQDSSQPTPLWAEISAQIIFQCDMPTPSPPTPINDWYLLVATYLTLKGRVVYSRSEIENLSNSELRENVVGYCLGAIIANSKEFDRFFSDDVKRLPPNIALCALEVIISANLDSSQWEKVWSAVSSLSTSEVLDTKVLSRVLGTTVALTGNLDGLAPWEGTIVGLGAVETAFATTTNDTMRTALLQKFIAVANVANRDIKTRAMGFSSLGWSTQIQPQVIEPFNEQVVLQAVDATEIDQSLIRIVQVGIFKHKYDNGLESRKLAFELLYLLTSNYANSFSSELGQKLWPAILRGLSDEHDIKMLACLIIQKLTPVNPASVADHTSEILGEFRKIVDTEVKESGLKLDHDKKAAIVRQISLTAKVLKNELGKRGVNDPRIDELA